MPQKRTNYGHNVGIVVIGRNEGHRLKRCINSVPKETPVVYVDSGSTDGSLAFARTTGIDVLELDVSHGFTAARARNQGWKLLLQRYPTMDFVQFVDGDCEMREHWLDNAINAMRAEPRLATVFGRRRERFPDASIYNLLCDDEWNVPVGLAYSCGGDALFRTKALKQVRGFSDGLIAGEEPDLCLRLRQYGWAIRRIGVEMTLHDADIKNFRAWWMRMIRSGYAYSEHVFIHRTDALPHWKRQLAAITIWTIVLLLGWVCLLFSLLSIATPVSAFLFAASAALVTIQAVRISFMKWRGARSLRLAFSYGGLMMIAKPAQFAGVLQFASDLLFRRNKKIIEYK